MNNQEEARRLLKFDALTAAEDMTGISYKEDETTSTLGFLLHMDNTEKKAKALRDLDDTPFPCPLEDYERIVESEGFWKIYEESFINSDNEDDKPDFFRIWWNELDGILLAYDTYWGGKSVNGGSFYYNWRPNDMKGRVRFTSSGQFVHVSGERNYGAPDDEYVWAGSHDCREAFRMKVNDLRNNGTFVKPWLHNSIFYMIHYMDTKHIDYSKNSAEWSKTARDKTSERYLKLPESVRTVIGEIRR